MAAATTWTPERLRALHRLVRLGLSAEGIGERLGVTADAVRQRASAIRLSVGKMGRPRQSSACAPVEVRDCPQARALARRAARWAREGDRLAALDLLARGVERVPPGADGRRSPVVASLQHLYDLIAAPDSHGPGGRMIDFGGEA